MTHAHAGQSGTSPAQAPFIVRVPGPIVSRLLRWGVPMGPNGVLEITGRKSGLPRPQPLAVATYAGRRYVVGAYGDVNWCRNLRAEPDAVLTLGRKSEPVTAIELTGDSALEFYRDTLPAYLEHLPLLWRVGVRHFIGGAAPTIFTDPIAAALHHPAFELVPRR